MDVTVRVHPLSNSSSKLRAFADVTINDQITMKGFKVMDGSNGLFASAPSHQAKDGKWYPDVTFQDEDLEKNVQKAIVDAYKMATSGGGNGSSGSKPQAKKPTNQFDDEPF